MKLLLDTWLIIFQNLSINFKIYVICCKKQDALFEFNFNEIEE